MPEPFPLSRLSWSPGVCDSLQKRNLEYLHTLDEGRLLHTFRLNAGLPTAAAPLGGWERPDCELRGHFLGHYLSGCAQAWASMRDEGIRRKAVRIVAVLAQCQRALGGKYLSAFPAEYFDRLRNGRRVWAPFYTLHKIMAGLLDVHLLCGSGQALEVLKGMAAWSDSWSAALDDAHMQRVLDVEHGGMIEVLANLYAVTRDESHLAQAKRFEHRRIFEPLAQGRDQLKGLHANTNIPKITGVARLHDLTGDKRYRTIAEFFWRTVVEGRSYATGGNSNFEHWRTAPGDLKGELSPRTQECCCTYNMLKLTRLLFGWNPLPDYAAYHERAWTNGILGTINPDDGMTMYFVPMAAGYWKLYSRPNDSFWCCTGTGIENFSKLADSVYYREGDTLYVNLFTPALLDWKERGVRVGQKTSFPHEESAVIEFEADKPVELKLRVRVPYWTGGGFRASINGRPAVGSPAGWLDLQRVWSAGDRVELKLPMNLRWEALPGDPSMQSLMYGPLVLAGRLGKAELTREMQYGSMETEASWSQAIKGAPVEAPELLPPSVDPGRWIHRVEGYPLEFRTTGQRRNVDFLPLNELSGERFAVYWKIRSS
jgi:hypothetical protein